MGRKLPNPFLFPKKNEIFRVYPDFREKIPDLLICFAVWPFSRRNCPDKCFLPRGHDQIDQGTLYLQVVRILGQPTIANCSSLIQMDTSMRDNRLSLV